MTKPTDKSESESGAQNPPAQVNPKTRKKRTPKDPSKLTAGELLLKQSRDWTAECIKLRAAVDAIETASERGLGVIQDAVMSRQIALKPEMALKPVSTT